MIRQLTSRITYKKHTIFVCFSFWKPASSYSPGPASQTPSPAGTALPRCPSRLVLRSAFRSRYGAGFCLFQSLIFFPRRLTARGCALTRSSVNLAGHGDFNHAFRFSRIVDINKKHTIFVCFLFWKPASSYSPGPASQTPSPAGTAPSALPEPARPPLRFPLALWRGILSVSVTHFLPAPLNRSRRALRCALSAILAGHGDFNPAFCSYPIVDIKQKAHDFRVLFVLETGVVILSRAVSSQVPSALMSLTSVFGMRTGGTSSP